MLDILASLASSSPHTGQGFFHQRPPGSSPVYRVSTWTFNFYTFTGSIELPDKGNHIPISPSTACLMPPGTCRRFHFSRPGAQWGAHFVPAETVRAVEPLLIDAQAYQGELSFLSDALVSCHQEARRNAVLWHLLWLLHNIAQDAVATNTGHHLVDKAAAYMRRHLAAGITVADVVNASSCSHNHLTRLFRQYADTTIVGYLRHLRMQRAQMLLTQTDLPIGVIAEDVGIADPHLFNKTVRRHFGMAPSRLRDKQKPSQQPEDRPQ